MTCVVIEDEPLSSGILEDYIQEAAFLDLKAVFRDAVSALEFLRAEPVDLHFIDLHLPKLKGFDLLRSFPLTGQVIITTAYHEYALEGYELGISDYLLKPICFDRFLKSVHKAWDYFHYKKNHGAGEAHTLPYRDKDLIFFKSGPLIHKVDVTDITWLEKKGNYFELNTKTGTRLLLRANFADLFEKLPAKNFFRIHKSYIVNLRHVETIENSYIQVNKRRIPISLSFKSEFMRTILHLID
jgi:DNA-binding LytR/AlgR family response regulator